MTTAERRSLLLYAAGGLMTAGGLASLGSDVYSMLAKLRANRAIDRDLKATGKDLAGHVIAGNIPKDSRVLTDRKDIVAALDSNSDANVSGPLSRSLARLGNRIAANQVTSGNNAMYIGVRDGAPVFCFPRGPVGEGLLRHEVGHYLADAKRGKGGNYIKEYVDAATRGHGLSDVFNPTMPVDSKGRLTRYGLESEAWDTAGVPPSDELRRAALGTYRAANIRSGVRKVALLSILGGAGLGIYALKRYPLHWYS